MDSYEIKKNILKGFKYLIVVYVNIYLNIVIIKFKNWIINCMMEFILIFYLKMKINGN